ncbi:MAG: hypothetical protein KatS3mg105_1480 [Gemmatales bacterium]|nr:MAG: hypothetical protein KatS3mg105_1480 [Gemmatales bacterium]
MASGRQVPVERKTLRYWEQKSLMQPIKFACIHCNSMMAVGPELVGRQVVCPHCKKTVTAPAAPASQAVQPAPVAPAPVQPAPAPQTSVPVPAGIDLPTFQVPDRGEAESIFEAPEQDDLFDAPAPTVELPPNVANDAASTEAAQFSTQVPDQQEAPFHDASPFTDAPVSPDQTTVPDESAGEGAAHARQLARQRAEQESLTSYYLLVILVPYSILMTIATITLYIFYSNQDRHPLFQIMPDWPRGQQKPYNGGEFNRVIDDKPVDPRLRVALGETKRFNDLEVTPLRVERRKITYMGRGQPQLSHNDALVLTLKVKNVSKSYAFYPNDLAYNRFVEPNTPRSNLPYTCLELSKDRWRFYGGPCRWPRRIAGEGWRESDPLEWIAGTEHDKMLKPGEELELIVCTNPDSEKNAG